jgi:hypothetical protein
MVVNNPQGQQQIQVTCPPNILSGAYSNNVIISHTREEFLMDFMMVTPPQGVVVSRIIMSPGHMKRLISALQDNMKKYEASFGKLEAAEEPKGTLGFR